MRLAVILATRGRPELLMRTLGTTLRNVDRPGTVITVAVDEDDAATVDAIQHIHHPKVIFDVRPREDSLGEKYNRILEGTAADVFLVMVDYAPHVTPGFDTKILDAAAQFPDGIGAVYNHMANRSFPQINAVTAGLARRMGGIYPPYFPYWFVDHWLDDIARMIDRIAVADVWVDVSQRPGTMERREPALWAALFDALTLRRRKVAHDIVRSIGFDEPAWRKQYLLSPLHYLRIEERSQMVNLECRSIPDSGEPHDARYARIRSRGLALLQDAARDIELDALDRPFGQQDPDELRFLLCHAMGKQSVLEIGSCFGHTLRAFADVLAPGARLRSIDLGVLPAEAGSFAGISIKDKLAAAIDGLSARGFDAEGSFGDSKWPGSHGFARAAAPYDLIFIDGDHTYDGVKADWENYGTLGRIVAFHDIAHPDCGVSRLWAEIKAQGYQTAEMVRSTQGIGVVFMPDSQGVH